MRKRRGKRGRKRKAEVRDSEQTESVGAANRCRVGLKATIRTPYHKLNRPTYIAFEGHRRTVQTSAHVREYYHRDRGSFERRPHSPEVSSNARDRYGRDSRVYPRYSYSAEVSSDARGRHRHTRAHTRYPHHAEVSYDASGRHDLDSRANQRYPHSAVMSFAASGRDYTAYSRNILSAEMPFAASPSQRHVRDSRAEGEALYPGAEDMPKVKLEVEDCEDEARSTVFQEGNGVEAASESHTDHEFSGVKSEDDSNSSEMDSSEDESLLSSSEDEVPESEGPVGPAAVTKQVEIIREMIKSKTTKISHLEAQAAEINRLLAAERQEIRNLSFVLSGLETKRTEVGEVDKLVRQSVPKLEDV